jgi:uncharacterized membrane protein
MHLSEAERREINARAARLEARTGVEAVAAVVGRCDAYPEIPWKAFALFAALAALALPALEEPVLAGLTILGAGATAALAAVLAPPFARRFLGAARGETETRQYAESFFLARNLGRTEKRNAILVLVGLFERSVVILPDAGLRLGEADLREPIARMLPALAAGNITAALRDGLDAIEALLAAKGFKGEGGRDEIAQEVFEEKGA